LSRRSTSKAKPDTRKHIPEKRKRKHEAGSNGSKAKTIKMQARKKIKKKNRKRSSEREKKRERNKPLFLPQLRWPAVNVSVTHESESLYTENTSCNSKAFTSEAAAEEEEGKAVCGFGLEEAEETEDKAVRAGEEKGESEEEVEEKEEEEEQKGEEG
jgi:hypothetical protein